MTGLEILALVGVVLLVGACLYFSFKKGEEACCTPEEKGVILEAKNKGCCGPTAKKKVSKKKTSKKQSKKKVVKKKASKKTVKKKATSRKKKGEQ